MEPDSGDVWREHTDQLSDQQIRDHLAVGAGMRAMWGHAPPGGPATSGGYAWDPAELDEIIAECERERDGLEEDDRRYEQLAAARPIAPDEPASVPYSAQVRDWGKVALRQNQDWRGYVDDFIEKLKQARAAMQRQEGQASADIANANRDLA